MNLIIAAYWTEDDAADATAKMAEAVDGHIPGTGGVVSLDVSNVDARLRHFLRSIQLDEAANAA